MSLTPTQSQNLAAFPIELNLPGGPLEFLDEAADAIKWACRHSAQWKKVRCYCVRRLKDGRQSWQTPFTLYALEIGDSVDFDWTWESSLVLCPRSPDEFRRQVNGSTGDVSGPAGLNSLETAWSGEIVEVDRVRRRLFVCSNDPARRPTTGTFYVQLQRDATGLHPIFCRPQFEHFRRALASRLSATRGRVHPHLVGEVTSVLPRFESIWRHSWSVIWSPPGTNSQPLIAKLIAQACNNNERILVVSATNKSLDLLSRAIGSELLVQSSGTIESGSIQRLGRTPYQNSYIRAGLNDMLRCSESQLLSNLLRLHHRLRSATGDERSNVENLIKQLRGQLQERSDRLLLSPEMRVVMCGVDQAIASVGQKVFRAMFAQGRAPFTTVVVDHVGMIPRAQLAVISLLAARRVILVGDPKRHCPSKSNCRVLPSGRATWLSRSGMDDLINVKQRGPYVFVFDQQDRMHPDICELVSDYQYNKLLQCDEQIERRESVLPDSFSRLPRSVWYVLDDDTEDDLTANAEPGRGPNSWTRPKTLSVLKKLFADEQIRAMRGLFVTPFVQQARQIARYFSEEGMHRWLATTTSGSSEIEADIVIFDPVNAGSTTWQANDWRRMVTAGLSAAREFVILLASRAEMQQSFLQPLVSHMARRVLVTTSDGQQWKYVSDHLGYTVPEKIAEDPNRLGYQINQRKKLRVVLNAEQQRLCGDDVIGRTRLVHGVAGSGKTVVMANALVKTVDQLSKDARAIVWAVYGNASAKELIHRTIEEAWSGYANDTPFPWHRVEVFHVRELLEGLLREIGVKVYADVHYDRLAATFLTKQPPNEIEPRCHALFIDEAQDLGTPTIRLLSRHVHPAIEGDSRSRTITLLYDDAQDLDGTHTIHWDELGLDVVQERTVMRESFRGTQVINEFALNVLYRLESPDRSPEHQHLIEQGLIEAVDRDDNTWWKVRHNHVDGPLPIYRVFTAIEQQVDAIGNQLIEWIRDESVLPADIAILYTGRLVAKQLRGRLRERLSEIGVDLYVPSGEMERREDHMVVLVTPSKFKGHESEIVVIAGADEFVAGDDNIMARTLYVAMTRARSVLAIFGKNRRTPAVTNLLTTIQDCWNQLAAQSAVDDEESAVDEFADLSQQIGIQHESWLKHLWANHGIQREPIVSKNGEILADPLFWFQNGSATYACFGQREPGRQTQFKLADANIKVIEPGQELG